MGVDNKCEMPTRDDINAAPPPPPPFMGTGDWPGPKDQQNKTFFLFSPWCHVILLPLGGP